MSQSVSQSVNCNYGQSAWWLISSLFDLFNQSSLLLHFCCYCSTPCCSLLGIEMTTDRTSSSGEQQPSKATDNRETFSSLLTFLMPSLPSTIRTEVHVALRSLVIKPAVFIFNHTRYRTISWLAAVMCIHVSVFVFIIIMFACMSGLDICVYSAAPWSVASPGQWV